VLLKSSCSTRYATVVSLTGRQKIIHPTKLAAFVSSDREWRRFHGPQVGQRSEGTGMDWFLDWDGTITTKYTLSVVASIGYNKNIHQNLPPWSHFSEAYSSDYAAHLAKRDHEGKVRTSLEDFLAWQESFVGVERASVERVERAGISANVTTTDVDDGALNAMQSQRVVLRPGLGGLLEDIHKRGGSLTVISLNWSASFIASCLGNGLELQFKKPPNNIKVQANDIVSGPRPKLSRTFEDEDRGVWTANDKARIMQAELLGIPHGQNSIHVGDSMSDLPCLLLANVGICIRDDPLSSEQRSLKETLLSFDISCHWVGNYSLMDSSDGAQVKQLWWARDFNEIHNSTLLSGCHFSSA
jgi:thiamine phosphate phosphatase / amino-HMP aminohydrolase